MKPSSGIGDTGDTRLVVALSHKSNFAFYRQSIEAATLFVRDKRDTYYALYAGSLTDLVQAVVREHGFTEVLFFGLSKGGYGALLLSAMLGYRQPELRVRALAFSPVMQLYPRNANVGFPSYLKMLDRADRNDTLRGNLEKYGDLKTWVGAPNVFWRIVYSENNAPDVREAATIVHPNVQKYPLPFSFHGTTIPFTLRRDDPSHVRGEVDAIYREAETDDDLRATLRPCLEDLRGQLLSARWIPTLTGMIDETFSINF